ncbi:MAG: VPLPA-CTERM sorting domain-containing protein [Pseudomonadota bacterium]
MRPFFKAITLAVLAATSSTASQAATVAASAAGGIEATLSFQSVPSGVTIDISVVEEVNFTDTILFNTVDPLGAPSVSFLNENPAISINGASVRVTAASRTVIDAVPGTGGFAAEQSGAVLQTTFTNTTSMTQSILAVLDVSAGLVTNIAQNSGVDTAQAAYTAIWVPASPSGQPVPFLQENATLLQIPGDPDGVFTANENKLSSIALSIDPFSSVEYEFVAGAGTFVSAVRTGTQPPLTPVPLPAGAPLLLAGFGVFALARRRRNT